VGGLIQADCGTRAFKVDQYVNTSDGLTGYIYEDNGGDEESRPYQIAICEHDEERSVSASEVALWSPKAGDVDLEPVWID
jgi:hypothetical protein